MDQRGGSKLNETGLGLRHCLDLSRYILHTMDILYSVLQQELWSRVGVLSRRSKIVYNFDKDK